MTAESTSTRSRAGSWSGGGGTLTRRTGSSDASGSSPSAGRQALDGLRRAARGTVAWLRGTVTPIGWLLVLVLVAGIIAGAAAGLVEGWVTAAVAAALLVLSVPFLAGGADFDIRLDLDRDRVVAGQDVGATLRVVNRAPRLSLPGVVDVPIGDGLVESPVPLLAAGAEHAERLTIGARRRGVVQVGPMTVARGDPIGILRRELSWPQVHTLYVHPATVAVPAASAGQVKDIEGTPTRFIVDSDLAFHAIREYVPGDSRRHVHWKSTAKTGRLMVRQYEETRRARIAVLLDVAADGYRDEDEFELAVSAGASLAVQGVRDGRDVLMATAERRVGSQVSIRTLSTRSPKALLDATCRIAIDADAERLEEVTALTAQSFPELSIAFVVTGSQVPIARLRRAAFAFPSTARAVIVRADPIAEPVLRATTDFTLVTIGVLGDLKHLIARGTFS